METVADEQRTRVPRALSVALLAFGAMCANPVLLMIVGVGPLQAVGMLLIVIVLLQLSWRHWGSRLPTVYAVNFVALAGVWLHTEALVRSQFHDYVMEDLYKQHGDYYHNRPLLRSRLRDKEYEVDYLTNTDGYRIGWSHDPTRPVGHVDWLFIGDSYTQGAQVSFEDLYTSELYRRFPDRTVLNAGVSGWGLYESLAFLKARRTELRPQRVFVQIANFNDFMKVAPRRAGLSDYLMQESEAVRLLLQGIKFKNPTNLPLGRWVEPFYSTDDENRRYNVFYTGSSREKERDLASVRAVLRDLAAVCHEIGAQLVLIQVPTKEQVRLSYLEEAVVGLRIDPQMLDMELPNRLVRAIADSLGVPVLDPLEEWRQSPTFPFFHYDEHLNEAGHRMLAETLQSFLASEGETSDVRMLSTSSGGDRYPQFLAGGDSILFQSPRGGNFELVIADTLTWTEELLTQDDVDETHPIVIPGQDVMIFVAGYAAGGQTHLYRSDRRGRGAVQLDQESGDNAGIPAAFPDGESIVFPIWRRGDPSSRVRLARLWLSDGRREMLSQDVEEAWRPVVGPDGRSIAYIGKSDGQFDVYEYDTQSGETRRLTHTPYDEWDPTYSPDGRSIVYAARADGNWDLFRLRRGDGSVERLTRTSGDEWDPMVARSGRTVVFGGEYGLMRGIYSMPVTP